MKILHFRSPECKGYGDPFSNSWIGADRYFFLRIAASACFRGADPITIEVDPAKLLVRAEKLAVWQESVPIAVHRAEPMTRL